MLSQRSGSLKETLEVQREPLSAQVSAPLREAWQNVGAVLASSTATIVTVATAALPWLIIGLPLLGLSRWLWKRRARFKFW